MLLTWIWHRQLSSLRKLKMHNRFQWRYSKQRSFQRLTPICLLRRPRKRMPKARRTKRIKLFWRVALQNLLNRAQTLPRMKPNQCQRAQLLRRAHLPHRYLNQQQTTNLTKPWEKQKASNFKSSGFYRYRKWPKASKTWDQAGNSTKKNSTSHRQSSRNWIKTLRTWSMSSTRCKRKLA